MYPPMVPSNVQGIVQGVKHRMVLVGICFVFLQLLCFYLLLIYCI